MSAESRTILLASTICSVLLAGCAATFYGTDGKPLAKIPWPQHGEMTADGRTVRADPGEHTVDAATTVALAIVRESPQYIGSVIDTLDKHAESQQRQ